MYNWKIEGYVWNHSEKEMPDQSICSGCGEGSIKLFNCRKMGYEKYMFKVEEIFDGAPVDYWVPDGWRLPTIGEAVTLYDEYFKGELRDTLKKISLPARWFWAFSVSLGKRVAVCRKYDGTISVDLTTDSAYVVLLLKDEREEKSESKKERPVFA